MKSMQCALPLLLKGWHNTCNIRRDDDINSGERMITGMDISDKNGALDWELFGNREIAYVYIKASEALNSVDAMFAENHKHAREHGLLIGAYHWLHPQLHIGQQAETFFRTVKDFSGMLPPAVVLSTHTASVHDMNRNVKRFMELIHNALGVIPVLYTSETFWTEQFQEGEWGCQYPLWIDKPGNFFPKQLWPWAGWTIWQYSFKADLPGVPTPPGLNLFNGSMADLEKMVMQ